MTIKHLLIFSLFVSTNLQANTFIQEQYGEVTLDNITEVYDGDSFKANINSWPAIIGKEIIVRIKGIDAPELPGKCQQEHLLAKLSRQHTAQLLDQSFRIELKNMQRDRYFRILADVYVDRIDLGKSLISHHLAIPYQGGPKHNWCQ